MIRFVVSYTLIKPLIGKLTVLLLKDHMVLLCKRCICMYRQEIVLENDLCSQRQYTLSKT